MTELAEAQISVGGIDTNSPIQVMMRDIVSAVRQLISDGLDDPENELATIHPRMVISMVVTNILVNLVDRSLKPSLDIGTRLLLIQDAVDEVATLSLKLFSAMEAAKADPSTAH